MLSLDGLWKEHLDRPLCGRKEPIAKSHMYDCYNSTGEFRGWKRTETDFFRHQLREAIIKSRVSAYCIGCVRKDWDDLMQGDMRGPHGDAEGFAIRHCFVKAIKWATENSFDPDISFIFDDTGRLEREVRTVFHAFKVSTASPNVVGLSLLSSREFLPLQAADLIAWEYYRHCVVMVEKGYNAEAVPEIDHLAKNMHMDCQFADRNQSSVSNRSWTGTIPQRTSRSWLIISRLLIPAICRLRSNGRNLLYRGG